MADGRIVAVGPELAGAGARGDRRARAARPARRGRRPRPPQRARARRLGGLRDRHRGAGGRRHDVARSTCRSTRSRRPSTAPPSTPRSRRRRASRASTSRCGAASSRRPRPPRRARARAASSASRPSCRPAGCEEFEAADDLTLLEGMARAARLGLPVAVHAESEELTRRLARRAVAEGRVGVRDYLASRPVLAELEAIAPRDRLRRRDGLRAARRPRLAAAAAWRWWRRRGRGGST